MHYSTKTGIRQIEALFPAVLRMFWGLPAPDPFVRDMDPDPDPSIIKQK